MSLILFICQRKKAFINTRNAKRILDIFDPETGTLKELIKPQEPLSKKEALIIMEQIWNRIDETSILQAWENSILTYTSQLQINEDEIAKVKASCKTTLQRVEKEVRENVPVFDLIQLKKYHIYQRDMFLIGQKAKQALRNARRSNQRQTNQLAQAIPPMIYPGQPAPPMIYPDRPAPPMYQPQQNNGPIFYND